MRSLLATLFLATGGLLHGADIVALCIGNNSYLRTEDQLEYQKSQGLPQSAMLDQAPLQSMGLTGIQEKSEPVPARVAPPQTPKAPSIPSETKKLTDEQERLRKEINRPSELESKTNI